MLFGWPLVALVLFSTLPARRAILIIVLGGWLFLPVASFNLPGLPPYNKLIATNLAAFLGAILVDARSWRGLRLTVWDAPMIAWLIVPFVSAISAKGDAYDGLSAVLEQLLQWGLPYALGRVYFSDRVGVRELAMGVVIAGLVYAPLCLWEIRMSPRLHLQLYGMRQHNMFGQARRLEGWRPMVFMQHGLAVALFMAAATVTAFWLAVSRSWTRLWGLPAWAYVLLLVVTTVLCKSMAAVGLMFVAMGALVALRVPRMRLGLVVMAVIPMVYIGLRASGAWDGSQFISLAEAISETARDSITTRVESEDAFLSKLGGSRLFGFSRSGWKVLDKNGNLAAIPDGLWIISAMRTGLVGVVALYATFVIPPLLALRRMTTMAAATSLAGPQAALAAVLLMFANDCLLNAMLNPIFPLIAGVLVAFGTQARGPTLARPAAVRLGGAPSPKRVSMGDT